MTHAEKNVAATTRACRSGASDGDGDGDWVGDGEGDGETVGVSGDGDGLGPVTPAGSRRRSRTQSVPATMSAATTIPPAMIQGPLRTAPL